MYYCGKCGTEVSNKVKFCPKCGAIQKVNTKENDINSSDYSRLMTDMRPVRSQKNVEIYENISSKRDIIKLVSIGLIIGIIILAAGFGGYYFYTKNYKVSSQQNISKTEENATASKNDGSNKDGNASEDSKEANSTNDTNSSNKETNSGDYIFNDSSNVKLTDVQLNSLSKENLALARNEIYARHGYVFQTEPYKSYFASKTWYKPNSDFKGSDEEINEVERYNVQLILSYEKNK